MSKIIMYRTSSGLTPADQHQWEELGKNRIKVGSLVECKITMPRNLQFHRKFFALIHETFNMQESYETVEQWRAVVTAGAGYCTFIPDRKGGLVAVPESIAFHNMDESRFSRLYDDVINFICERYVDQSSEDLARVVEFL